MRTLTAGSARDAVRVGRPVDVRGVLAADPGSRAAAGAAAGRRLAAGRPDPRPPPTARYSFTVTPAAPGFSRYRVVRDAGPGRPASVATLPALDVLPRCTPTG